MSCDYAVWCTEKQLTNVEAIKLYKQLCEGITEGVVENDAVEVLYKELTTKHPEIDDVEEKDIDNSDVCPWSVKIDRSLGHLILCCVWSKSGYVYSLVKDLARKYNLAFFDPQSGTVFYPFSSLT
ncbi:MAG: hypothetical protein FD122_3735 [Stygiobacter sp.]|nr:MAG: hypothetical protein FD122_3735 [Stygiobacter sp.]